MFRKLLLKTTMMETNFFCLANSCRSLQLWASSFDVSLVWVLNPFGVRISNLPKLQQATTREFSWKIPVEERTNFCVKWRPYNRTIVDTYFDLQNHSYFLWNCVFIIFFMNFVCRILNLQATIKEFSWKSSAEEITNFSVK